MGSFSIWHILILGGAALLLFGGRGKISDFMGDFGKGIRSFKKGLVEEDAESRASRTDLDENPSSVAKCTSPTTLASVVPAQAIAES